MVLSCKPPAPPQTPRRTPTQKTQPAIPTANAPQHANNASARTGSGPASTGTGSATAPTGSVSVVQTPAAAAPATQPYTASNNTSSNSPRQQQSPQQGQNNTNGIRCGPKRPDQIFISQVADSYSSVNIKDHIHAHTNIDMEHIEVEFLFKRNNNRAFKIVVPNGKMQQTIAAMGSDIKAEPYKDKSQRSTTGQARGPRWWHNNHNTFRGPPAARRPPKMQPFQHPDNFGWGPSYHQPKWTYYGPPRGSYF